MKLSFLRPALVLALALGLTACGGKASFPVTGSVTGLTYSGLVLTTNGMDLNVAAGATSFSFPNSLEYGDSFDITVKNPPQHQDCGVSGGKDTAGRLAAINVVVTCTLKSYTIGGPITDLTSAGLVLTNGSSGGTATPAAGATSFILPPVTYNNSYGVTVLTQPASDVCTVSPEGVGIMGDAPVGNIAVTCKPKT